jgi:fucose permease
MTLLGDPILWLTALAFLFYTPMEATMGAWATTYLHDKQVPGAAASTLLSAFWLAFTISRLGVAGIVATFPLLAGETGWLIIGLSLFCLAAWIGVVISPNKEMASGMVVLSGLAFGPVFPTIMGILTGHVPSSIAGRAVGLFFMIGGIGWAVIPALIGKYAYRRGVQRAFGLAVASSVGLTATAVVLRWFLF